MAAGSFLLAREYFDRGDPAFVGELLRCGGGKRLRAFALLWSKSREDFASRARIAFADRGVSEGDARVLVKVLFKEAEQRGDDVEVAHHLVAFDRHTPRIARERVGWDWQAREYRSFGWWRELQERPRGEDGPQSHFSNRTRYYLQRRAFRYLRRLAAKAPERFLNAAVLALSLYEEDHFPFPDSILDCRSLCLLLYAGSPQLRVSREISLASGALSDLEPAPYQPEIWRTVSAFDALLSLVVAARSSFVRGWCARWLKLVHEARLASLPLARLRPLLASPHGEAQSLGAELLEVVEGWGELPVATWLELAALDNPQALTVLARLMQEHVAPSRLSVQQCLELSKSRVLPIAELGLLWAMEKGLGDDEAVGATSAIADAETEEVRRRGMEWLRPRLSDKKRSMLLRELVDSRHRDVREVALEVSGEAPYATDMRVHAAMAESPYGDVTDTLAERLRDWQSSLDERSLHHLWATILLGVRRGSRAKRTTLRILAERAVAHPDKAPELLPLVAVALRSVREPERRAALATLARAGFARPELRAMIEEHIGELTFGNIGGQVAS